ncbi:hypothetical protein LDENG_00013910 [Lucifuga dentata]|nr:hypothetical protein LDENG_00013910 [Lucifuga dentata]
MQHSSCSCVGNSYSSGPCISTDPACWRFIHPSQLLLLRLSGIPSSLLPFIHPSVCLHPSTGVLRPHLGRSRPFLISGPDNFLSIRFATRHQELIPAFCGLCLWCSRSPPMVWSSEVCNLLQPQHHHPNSLLPLTEEKPLSIDLFTNMADVLQQATDRFS